MALQDSQSVNEFANPLVHILLLTAATCSELGRSWETQDAAKISPQTVDGLNEYGGLSAVGEGDMRTMPLHERQLADEQPSTPFGGCLSDSPLPSGRLTLPGPS